MATKDQGKTKEHKIAERQVEQHFQGRKCEPVFLISGGSQYD